MVILFLNKKNSQLRQSEHFSGEELLLPGFPLSTFFPAFTELPSGPQEVGNCWLQDLSSAPGVTQRGCLQLVTTAPTRLPCTASVAPHARHQAFTSIFSVPYNPPNIHTEKNLYSVC